MKTKTNKQKVKIRGKSASKIFSFWNEISGTGGQWNLSWVTTFCLVNSDLGCSRVVLKLTRFDNWQLESVTKKICCVAFSCFLLQCKQHRIMSVRVSLEPLTLWIPLILNEMWMTTLNEPLVQTVEPLLPWALFKQKWTTQKKAY